MLEKIYERKQMKFMLRAGKAFQLKTIQQLKNESFCTDFPHKLCFLFKDDDFVGNAHIWRSIET